ncbi:MAG: glycosyltransferase [Acidimicrobiales bacterium]|nr:glycosyltransferase [Acidimicrobiales bacterium]
MNPTVPSSSRPRVLYLTAGFPYPLFSGYLRHHFLVRELAVDHDVVLASLVGPSFRPEHAHAMQPWAQQVLTFGGSKPDAVEQGRRVVAPLVATGAVRDLCRAVDDHLRAGRIDVVVLSGKDTAPAAAVVERHGIPLVVDLCDATSARLGREARHADGSRRAVLRARRQSVRVVERRLERAADVVLTASERDLEHLRRDASDPAALDGAVVVPNGVDAGYWHRTSARLGESVAFCGNLAYRPNADAADVLLRAVMPQVWNERPDARLLLIGRGTPQDLVRASRGLPVELTGEVPDVRPYLERAATFAAPLRSAAGIQNKVLEAMAMEIPVIASPLAVDGLRIGGESPPVECVAPDEMAPAILRSLDAAARTGRPDAAARAWVGERFVWEASGQRLASAISTAIGRPAPQAERSAVPPC